MKFARFGLACSSMLLLLASAAHAAAPDEVAARLKALMEAQGGSFAWSSVSGAGDEAAIEGATLTPPGESDAVQLGTIDMSGIEETADGALRVSQLTAPGYSYERGGTTYEATDLEVRGLVLPAAAEADGEAPPRLEAIRMASVKIAKADRPLLAATDIAYDIDVPEAEGEPISVAVTAGRFDATSSKDRYPVADDIAAIMGIDSFAGSLSARGTWDPVEGNVALERSEMKLDDTGTLTLSFSGSGYTSELVKAGRGMSLDLGGGDSLESMMSQGMAMFGLASKVTFDGASLRFEAGPRTRPDPRAAKAARDRIARDLAPFGKEFAAKSIAEIDEYLADPRSLEISADPAEPVGASTLMLALVASPRQLPEQLGLAIKANE